MNLADKKCIPCRGGTPPLPSEEADVLLSSLGNAWGFDPSGHLEKRFACKDFVAALSLANRVGAIAEEEAHHPDLHVRWGELRVEIWTHKIDGLTESDFILAAKIDRALDSQT